MYSEEHNYYVFKNGVGERRYYRINKNNNRLEIFNGSNLWSKSAFSKTGETRNGIERNFKPIPLPITPHSCDKCQNKGCENCRPIPWSIYNVFNSQR